MGNSVECILFITLFTVVSSVCIISIHVFYRGKCYEIECFYGCMRCYNNNVNLESIEEKNNKLLLDL